MMPSRMYLSHFLITVKIKKMYILFIVIRFLQLYSTLIQIQLIQYVILYIVFYNAYKPNQNLHIKQIYLIQMYQCLKFKTLCFPVQLNVRLGH